MNALIPEFSRRGFLKGMTVSLGWVVTVPVVAAASTGYAQIPAGAARRRVVIYNDSAHFDDTGILDAYVPPASCAGSTKRYVESLSEEEFLKRHWFV